jgi:hypothetical protein
LNESRRKKTHENSSQAHHLPSLQSQLQSRARMLCEEEMNNWGMAAVIAWIIICCYLFAEILIWWSNILSLHSK